MDKDAQLGVLSTSRTAQDERRRVVIILHLQREPHHIALQIDIIKNFRTGAFEILKRNNGFN